MKGSSGAASTVDLTDGEVQHWSDDFERMLVVVDEIKWNKSDGSVATSGGVARVWRSWDLSDSGDSLQPIRYRYTLPGGADTLP